MRWIKQAANRLIGQRYERLAKTYLLNQQLEFIQQNYQCKSGEIDLIMQQHGTLIFVEVKYRSKADYGEPGEMITPGKIAKLKRAAKHYLVQQKYNEIHTPIRFDAILINGEFKRIEWLKNIF